MDQQSKRSLTYPSLRCVVSNMSSFKRIIDVSRVIGSGTNRGIPWRINQLVLADSSFVIDGLKFDYSLIRLGPLGPVEEYPDPGLAPGDMKIGDSGKPQNRDFDPLWCFVSYLPNPNFRKACTFPYGTKLQDALRSNLEHYFGKNKIHNVLNLEIGINQGILRLPEGLQFKIRQLIVPIKGDPVIRAVRRIIHEDSIPLERILIAVDSPDDWVLENRDFKNARSINIRIIKDPLRFADLVVNLPHKDIYISGVWFPVNITARILTKWKSQPPVQGTKFSFHVINIMLYSDNLEYKCAALNINGFTRVQNEEHFMSLALCDGSKINFYGYRAPGHGLEVERLPWVIVMEVVRTEQCAIRPAMENLEIS